MIFNDDDTRIAKIKANTFAVCDACMLCLNLSNRNMAHACYNLIVKQDRYGPVSRLL